MVGVNYSSTQANGVATTFATILDIRWQPGKAADVEIGFFIDESTFLGGAQPVATQYFALDITQIDPTLPIPPQLFAQIVASGGPCPGGTGV